MHLLKMKGAWSSSIGWLYETVVAKGLTPLYEKLVEEEIPCLGAGTVAIDVGCGQGQVSALLARRKPGWEITGLDLSPAMVARARKKSPDLPNLSFRQGDALNLSLEDSSVDLALSVASIKHWPDQLKGLQEIRRVLRPGGVLCILEADRCCTKEQAKRFVSYWRHVLPGTAWLVAYHFRKVIAGQALSLDELQDLLSQAGYVNLNMRQDTEQPLLGALAYKK